MALCAPHELPMERLEIPLELWRRRSGYSAEAKCREKRDNTSQAFRLLNIMVNIGSFPNKTEELAVLTRLQREYWECSVMCFTETWLNGLTPDTRVTVW